MALYDDPTLYEILRPVDTTLLRSILRLLELHATGPIESVLDPACGPGSWLLQFAKRGMRVAGNDSSEVMCRRAAELLATYPHEIVCGDMRSVVVASGPFDLAVEVSGVACELTHEGLRTHLQSVSDNLRLGGIYIVNLLGASADVLPELPYLQFSEVSSHGPTETRISYWIEEHSSSPEAVSMRRDIHRSGTLQLQDKYKLSLYGMSEVSSIVPATLSMMMPENRWDEIEFPRQPSSFLRETLYTLRKTSANNSETCQVMEEASDR